MSGSPASSGGETTPGGRAVDHRRLFLAFEVPTEQRLAAVERSQRLRAALPPARWLGPEAMHVTVLFLGQVEASACEPLAAALRAATADQPDRQLTLRGFGCFPPGRRARVLWVGVDCAPAAGGLHRALASAAAARGLAVEAESVYLPHLTLARCPRPWRTADAERLAAEYEEPLGPSFTAADVVLFESHLGRGGARHLPYARLPLQEVAC